MLAFIVTDHRAQWPDSCVLVGPIPAEERWRRGVLPAESCCEKRLAGWPAVGERSLHSYRS